MSNFTHVFYTKYRLAYYIYHLKKLEICECILVKYEIISSIYLYYYDVDPYEYLKSKLYYKIPSISNNC